MKKNIYLLLAGFAAMAMATSCSDNELVGNDASTSNQPKTITINASTAEGNDSRVAYADGSTKITTKWESDDSIKVVLPGWQTQTWLKFKSKSTDHRATFTGTVSKEPAKGTNLYGYVWSQDALMDYGTINSGKNAYAFVSLIDQDGTLANAESHNLLSTTASYKGDSTTFAFTYKLAIIKLKLTFPSTLGTNAETEVALTATSGLYSRVLLDSTMTFVQGAQGDVIAMVKATGGAEKDIYLCVYPGPSGNKLSGLGVKLVSNNKVYKKDLALADKTIEAGQVYSKTVDMSSVTPTTYLYYNDFNNLVWGGDEANYIEGIKPYFAQDANKLYHYSATAPNSLVVANQDGTFSFNSMDDDYFTMRNMTKAAGWGDTLVYERPGYLKLGKGSATKSNVKTINNGFITIPAFANITGTQNVVLTFDVVAWDGNASDGDLTMAVNGGGTPDITTFTVSKRTSKAVATWQHVKVNITGVTSKSTFTITSHNVYGISRILVDNIVVVSK
jgi:hypothetical protein